VRVRTTLVAVAVVGLAMLLGGIGLVGHLRDSLTDEVRRATELRAREIAAELEGTRAVALGLPGEDDQWVQVLDGNGQVLASSAEVTGRPPIAELEPGDSAQVHVPFDDDPLLVAAASADTADGARTVLVARTLDVVVESTRVVVVLLTLGLPVLLLIVGLTTWFVVGRTLRPVDAIRNEVDEISVAALHRRVPVPASTDEIGRLATTMNRMLDRLEGAQRRQRRFVSDASHELRSPVASLRQHAEVALAHPDRVTTTELAEVVLAEDLRLQQLVEDLLLLARVDEHSLQLAHRQVDLDDLVLDEARRLRQTTTLTIDTTGVSAARVEGDITALRRVLRNLGDNAARHARSRIAFALAEQNGTAVLGVDDDGPGIPVADRTRVFERFVRLDDARAQDAGGSGLGLAIVSDLVAAHRGSVTVSDSRLGGTRVETRLRTQGGLPTNGSS
jgi:signal transduction histidine kinase